MIQNTQFFIELFGVNNINKIKYKLLHYSVSFLCNKNRMY